MRQDFYQLKNPELKALAAEALGFLAKAVTYRNSSGYQVLKFKANPELKRMLEDLGFFNFHSTNKGVVAGVHQITLYLHKGMFRLRYGKGLTCRKGELEVHHRDSDRQNNDPKNLWYATPQQNRFCADVLELEYDGVVISGNVKHNFEFGSGLTDTARLIRMTAAATLRRLGFLEVEIPQVITFLLQLPGNVGKQIYSFWKNSVFGKELKEAVKERYYAVKTRQSRQAAAA